MSNTATLISGLNSKLSTFVWECAKGKLSSKNSKHGSGHVDQGANGTIAALKLVFLILLGLTIVYFFIEVYCKGHYLHENARYTVEVEENGTKIHEERQLLSTIDEDETIGCFCISRVKAHHGENYEKIQKANQELNGVIL